MYRFGHLLEEAGIGIQPSMPVDLPIILPDDGTPREHQVSGFNMVMSFDRAGVYDEQGTGKTLIAQAAAITDASIGNKTIAMMPPVLIPQFRRSMLNTFKGVEKKLKISRYEGTIEQRQRLVTEWVNHQSYPDIMLMSYDIFRSEALILFQQQGYFRLICDEATPLRDPKNLIYLAVNQFLGVRGERNLLLMTGTPAKNTLVDLYGLINLVTPGKYLNAKAFCAMHVDFVDIQIAESGRTVPKIVGYRNTDVLWSAFYAQARRVEKKQVLDLPEKLIVDFEVELSEKHAIAYRKLVRERLLIMPDNTVIDAINASALRQTAMQGVLNPKKLGVSGPSAIIEAVTELCSEIEGKVLVMAHYQDSVELLRTSFPKKNPAVINGLTKDPDAEKNRFINDPACTMLIINYTSGGVGVDGLQGVCNYAIAAEPTTVPGDFDQAIDRLHRDGQKNTVTCYVLRVPGTVSARSTDQMRRKKAQNESVVSAAQLRAELLDEELQAA